MSKNGGIIGVSDHGGWAVLVTATRDGTLLDRVQLRTDGTQSATLNPRGTTQLYIYPDFCSLTVGAPL